MIATTESSAQGNIQSKVDERARTLWEALDEERVVVADKEPLEIGRHFEGLKQRSIKARYWLANWIAAREEAAAQARALASRKTSPDNGKRRRVRYKHQMAC